MSDDMKTISDNYQRSEAIRKANEAREIDKEARELADTISRFINRMSGGRERAIALGKILAQDHRTLQQTHMAMCMSFIEEQVRHNDDGFYDARNEATVKLACKIWEPIRSDADFATHLPYI